MKNITFLLSAVLLCACGGSSDSSTAGSSVVDDETPATAALETSCLAEYRLKPCELLSVEEAAELTGLAVEGAEVEAPDEMDIEDNNDYSSLDCAYRWETDRSSEIIIKMGDKEMRQNFPLKDFFSVEIDKIVTEEELENTRTESAVAYFNRLYGKKTAEEKEQIKDAIERSKQSSDVDDKAADAISGMVDKDNTVDISDLGDAASVKRIGLKQYTNYKYAEMRVLHKNVILLILADVSDDTDADIAMAKKIAERVISKCN
jgi:hypothetical protein